MYNTELIKNIGRKISSSNCNTNVTENLLKVDSYSAGQAIPCFYGTRKLVVVLKSDRNCNSSWTSSFDTCPISLKLFLTVSAHVRIIFQSAVFPVDLSAKIVYAFFISFPKICSTLKGSTNGYQFVNWQLKLVNVALDLDSSDSYRVLAFPHVN